MKRLLTTLCIAITFLSCDKRISFKKTAKVNIDSLVNSKEKFLSYYFSTIDFESEYIGLNIDGKEISKLNFLKNIYDKGFYPVEVESNHTIKTYQLFELDSIRKKEYHKFLKAKADQYITNENLKGKHLPNFNFTDIEGKTYTSENIQGKVIVLKFWFLNCKPCIEEIPDLNTIVETYQDNKNVIFLSMALDNESNLKKFKQRKKYLYSIISNNDYIMNTLKVRVFPTHMILNKKGEIVYISGNAKKLHENIERILK